MSLINSYILWAAVHSDDAHTFAGTKKSALRQMEKLKRTGEIHQDAELMLVRFESHLANDDEIKKRIEAEAVLEEIEKQKGVEG